MRLMAFRKRLKDLYIQGGLSPMNYTYIVRCSDDTLYTGWTNDLEHRIRMHNEGKGAKYTRARRPVTLVYFEVFDTKKEAMQREYAIKHLPRPLKLELISHFRY